MDETASAFTLARHYLDIDRPAQALEALERVASPDLADPTYWHLRASALIDLERYGEAQQAVERGLALDPAEVRLLHDLFQVRRDLGDLAGAERAILDLLGEVPEEPGFLCDYAHLVARGGQLDKARRLADAAAALAPESRTVARTHALLDHFGGDDRGARRRARELLDADPEDAVGRFLTPRTLNEAARDAAALARDNPGDGAIAEAAREQRLAAHWLLWPLRPLRRIGPVGSWMIVAASLLLLLSVGAHGTAAVVGICWLALCVHSWVTPPLLRRWQSRRF